MPASRISWFSALFDELRTRNARAHASLLSPSTLPLRTWINRTLSAPSDSVDALQSTPVFEHKFGFLQAKPEMGELAPDILHERLITNMDRPPKEFHEQRFERDRHPYTHQLDAWKALTSADTSSVVVSAGTGGGKTECFLVPILNDLAVQEERQKAELVGVQALFLYPLNALINSQRERLSAWTRGFDGRIRYCLYNGETEETYKESEQAKCPERVMSRQRLRERPPPLLITNATMLEYMLVRPDDQAILQRSRGMLRYVVIDEAHTYIGSMAAELALLLRRVMNAFGVDPRDVRFIATSATLGSVDKVAQMRRFLADVAGQPEARVTVITDQRDIPAIPAPPIVGDVPEFDALDGLTAEQRFEVMCAHRAPRLVREWLVADGAQTARTLRGRLEQAGIGISEHEIVRLLDGCKSAKPSGGEPFLPLRGHAFVRGLQGLWACVDPACPGRKDTKLDDTSWPFGAVYTARRMTCGHEGCAGMVLELVLCQQCGSEGLIALDEGPRLAHVDYDEVLRPPLETDDIDTGDDQDGDDGVDEDRSVSIERARIVSRKAEEARRSRFFMPSITFTPSSGELDDVGPEYALTFPDHGKLQCPHCGYTGQDDRLSFRSCRTGRTFVMGVSVPVLLEHMPPYDDTDKLPFGGRRTITFTDSRQGTARFAARAQGESERNYVRSFVYHQVISEQAVDAARVAELRARVGQVEQAIAQLGDPSLLEAALRDARGQLAAAEGVRAVPLVNLASQLAILPAFKAMDRYWRDYLPFAEVGADAATLAKWMILREFARRPMRRASLETLGLVAVRLPGVGGRRPPELWFRWCTAAKADPERSWADLLKLLLDFYVRSNSAVQIDRSRDFFRWVGTNIYPKLVLPNKPPIKNERVAWPRFSERTRPRLAWLIVRAFGLDGGDHESRERVNDVLDEAWNHIRPSLRGTDGGYQLPMDNVALEPVDEAWVCPMTRMLLDTTLLGHTPYQPPLDRPFDTLCRKVRMPRISSPFWLEADAKEWLANDSLVREARAQGALSEFAERVLVFSTYYQVAEHSAQLQSATLQKAERQFKEGRLNLLSCSTTMEMGVDIGNLAGVAMNNAPPSPANFLQRVGRAGRRGEPAAVSLTVCRHLPHDQAVFAEPDWPFRTPIHITPVKLDSQRIVERHVRAAALTRFLQLATADAIRRLTCEWFFVPAEGQTESPCDRLLEWLETEDDAAFFKDLERLVRESSLHGVPAKSLLVQAGDAFRAVAERFGHIRKAIRDQMAGLPEEHVAARAMSRQLRRLDEDYLLGYLASEQVLPGYGFPTGVLPLVTTTAEELGALKRAKDKAAALRGQGQRESAEQRQARSDARTQLLGYPSRDLALALVEYAPGNKVVLDRRTYTSRGVTLNWHLRADAGGDSVREVQALQEAWRCSDCGDTGVERVRIPTCQTCRGGRLSWHRFLEPAGFAVDLREPAQMDASPPDHVPFEPPWISSGTVPLESIGQPALVRFRHAPDGQIAHISMGRSGLGYALCLRCGRAEAETAPRAGGANGDLPTGMNGHKRLRGGKGDATGPTDTPTACEGNGDSWAILRYLALGGAARTDVLELRLYDPQTQQLVEDLTLLTTTAVALRKEAARELGIDERELGYQVAQRVATPACCPTIRSTT